MSERVIRRRNVKSRNRTGCVTCRARRLKCDEGKPECNNCVRLNLPCGGYPQRLVFKDQTQLFSPNPPRKRHTRRTKTQGEVGEEDETNVSTAVEGSSASSEHLISSLGQYSEVEAPAFEDNEPQATACQPSSVFEAATSLALISGSTIQSDWSASSVDVLSSGPAPSLLGDQGLSCDIATPLEQAIDHTDQTPSAWNTLPPSPITGNETREAPWVQVFHHGIRVAPLVPQGLMDCYKFPEDMLYYHHLRDTSPYGLLSVLYLTKILDAHYLDGSFYHAALALSALKISQSEAPASLRNQANIHALEHFVIALGAVGKIQVEEDGAGPSTPASLHDPQRREKAVSWLSTVLFLAYFELQRGQMRLWYIHSRAAVDFLASHLNIVLASDIGESLIRSFSRIAALLDIYDRTHSVQRRVTSSEVSDSLLQLLKSSDSPYDRLLFIMPRVNQLEEEWRSNPRLDNQWEARVEALRLELKEWRDNLNATDVPWFDNDQLVEGVDDATGAPFDVVPFTILQSEEPVRAATNYAHYLVSLLRLDSMSPPGTDRKLTASESTVMLHSICRLAAGVPYSLCKIVNAYGHGMLPALMNAYHMADATRAEWIRGWIARLPKYREGIWNVGRVQRLLAYLDEEYSQQGSRPGRTLIKTRMVDLEEDRADPLPDGKSGESDSFHVEIYSKGKRGWSIDFVEIE